MTDGQFLARYGTLKKLLYLALFGLALFVGSITVLGDDLHPNIPSTVCAIIGAVAFVPGVFYIVALTIWHWKTRYRGNRSDLWGVVLVVETSGWFKLVYLFRHIIPDARGTGRYARPPIAGS